MIVHTLHKILAALAICAGLAVLAAVPATADESDVDSSGGPFMPPYSAPQ
ncbi:hypothetical protein [Saccharothrix sp. ALI-22-I]|nr:hypothetical protein [Saccharothrix sp. ALI-22-I]